MFLLKEIFSNHPDWDKKTKGKKVEKIIVKKSPNNSTKCFYLLFEDGSENDISYIKSIDRITYKERVIYAFREAIRPIIEAFKINHTFPCISETGNCEIASINDCHIDHHDLSFHEIVDNFMTLKNFNFEKLHEKVIGMKDNSSNVCFNDEELIKEFRQFHNKHTHLRAIHKDENLRKKRK